MNLFFRLFLLAAIVASCTDGTNKPASVAAQPSPVIKATPPTNLVSSPTSPDVSPLDVIYFPTDFPVQKMSQNGAALPVARVIYSRPLKQGRTIFGSLIPYNDTWRLGANESTEIEFFKPVTIQKKRVAAGRYILYCVPEATQWTLIFNTNIYSWGLKQDPSMDAHRFTIPTRKTEGVLEYFTMAFGKTPYGVDLTMSWDTVSASLPITL